MFKIKRPKIIEYEPKIGEVIKHHGIKIKCIKQIEDSDANGSFCSECYFHCIWPRHGQINSCCSVPNNIFLFCHARVRKDKQNVIFEKL